MMENMRAKAGQNLANDWTFGWAQWTRRNFVCMQAWRGTDLDWLAIPCDERADVLSA